MSKTSNTVFSSIAAKLAKKAGVSPSVARSFVFNSIGNITFARNARIVTEHVHAARRAYLE